MCANERSETCVRGLATLWQRGNWVGAQDVGGFRAPQISENGRFRSDIVRPPDQKAHDERA
eukprot:1386656-Alexandrium_andersonii.AAC.1